jgi:gliding motility-associated-like protein
VSYAGSVTCHGASTATANVTNIAGGSGTENYVWFNGLTTHTSSSALLSAGLWSITVTDAVTGCQINESFFITQPPAMNLVLSSSSPTACAGTSVGLSGVNSGGTPYSSGSAYTYTWTGGQTNYSTTVIQPASGNYIYTLTSADANNCPISNTIAIDFIQNPVLTVSSTSICPLETGFLTVNGATTYTWNNSVTGNNFSASPLTTAQYTVIGSALSCTSSAIGSIVVKPLPIPMILSNDPICNGQNLVLNSFGGVGFYWQGPSTYSSNIQSPTLNNASLSNGGVYALTVTAVNGCTASTTKTVTIHPTPTISALGSTVCVNQTLSLSAVSFPGASYVWSGPNFNSGLQNPVMANPPVSSSGTYTVKVTSAQGCSNTATADVTVTPMPTPLIISSNELCFGSNLSLAASGGVSYQWSGPAGFNSFLQNPSINNVTTAQSGIYQLQVSTGPCVASTSHTLVVHPLPSFTISSNVPCENDALQLNASSIANATYLWQFPSGVNSNSENPVINNSNLSHIGVYTLTVTDANSCKNMATHTTSVRENPTLTTISTTVCLNSPATLIADGASTYEWKGPGFFYATQPSALIPSASSSAVTIYTVTGTAANQCTAVATASLTTQKLPIPSLDVKPNERSCLNKPIRLEGFGGHAYEWRSPEGSIFRNKVYTFTATTLFYAGTYTLTVTDELGCSSQTTTTIYLDPLPNGGLTGTLMDACVPFQSDFKFVSASTATNITSEWQINNNGPLIKGKAFSRTFTSPGEYIIQGRFTDTISTCVNTATFVVNARAVPLADFSFSPEKPVEGFDQVLFTNTSTGEELAYWNWYFIDNEGQVSEQKNTSTVFSSAGIYPVAMVVKNKWGCADTMTKAVTVVPDFNVYVPDAFTPNGDGNNDAFMAVCTGVKSYELTVYNRWGRLLFKSEDINAAWDGTFNGTDCKSDVYVWKIKVSSQNGDMKAISGHVTLYR